MSDFGQIALLLSLFSAAYAFLIDILGVYRKETALIRSGRNATVACWIGLTAAMTVLMFMLVKCDFSCIYVAKHISIALPLVYKISALWAGAAGSLLLWLWIQVAFVAFVFRKTDVKNVAFAARARIYANFVNIVFLLVLIFDESPFTHFVPVPADGIGLNPLLQHPAMVLHPPALFIGYGALAIPFAWVFADLSNFRRKTLPPLFAQARNWTLIGWLFLSIGIILGAWWAYEELGWGGYWAWDPVENASLMPWLTATALLHSYRVYRTGSPIAHWLTILGLVTFSLCIFGTFLTRYGLIESVHSFSAPGLGILFMILLISIWLVAILLICRKYMLRPTVIHIATSRVARLITISNTLMILLAFVIFIGTIFPFLSGIFTGQKISLEPQYFTKITAPGGLLLLLMLGIGPHFLKRGLDKSWQTITAAAIGIMAVIWWILTKSLAIPYFVAAAFAILNIALDMTARVSAKKKDNQAHNSNTFSKSMRYYGARIAHIGIVLMLVGITASGAYDIEKDVVLKPGENVVAGRYDVEYHGLWADHGSNYTAVTAHITVSEDDKAIATLKPSRAYYYNGGQPTSEVDIRRSITGDIYVALTDIEKNTQLAQLRVSIKPLINWIWIGAIMVILGAVLVIVSVIWKSNMPAASQLLPAKSR